MKKKPVIREKSQRQGSNIYQYRGFECWYKPEDRFRYAEQERILESIGKDGLTEFIMSKIAQDSMVEQIKEVLREMLSTGELKYHPTEQEPIGEGNQDLVDYLMNLRSS